MFRGYKSGSVGQYPQALSRRYVRAAIGTAEGLV